MFSTSTQKTNKDKIKYMRILRDHIKEYKFDKYVKKPEYFCHLDWWYAKDAFLPLPFQRNMVLKVKLL